MGDDAVASETLGGAEPEDHADGAQRRRKQQPIQLRDRLTAEAYYFWTEIEGLIDRVPIGTSGGTTYNIRRNVGEARVQGFELAGEFLLSCDWTMYGNLAYQLGENVTDAEPLRRIP